MIQPTVTNDKRPVSRGLRAITVRLDQPTRERINQGFQPTTERCRRWSVPA